MLVFGLNIWAAFNEYPAQYLIQMFAVGVGGGLLSLVISVWYPRAGKLFGLGVVGVELIYLLIIFNEATKRLPF